MSAATSSTASRCGRRLRRAEGIDYLEYLLPNPFLRDVTLVDTPGTAAVVDEHQDRTAEFLNLQRQLRHRHSQETQRLGSEADAVIYLVGQALRATDQAFLEEFGQATSGQVASNAIGVLAKIDLQPEILARRAELADKVACQLKANLNTVVPVSAGLHQAMTALCAHDSCDLLRLMTELRRIPPRRSKSCSIAMSCTRWITTIAPSRWPNVWPCGARCRGPFSPPLLALPRARTWTVQRSAAN